MKVKWTNCMAAVVLTLLGGAFMKSYAQQTIFNVPSADDLPKGKVYGEMDVAWKPVDSKFS
jgi:hypothetical protein